ncbi:MAG: alpha/beta hydrolase-fold protein, partial [Gammaproteobacteria bacterium]
GQKAFRGYLGDKVETWKEYDSLELMRNAEKFLPMLVDQGDGDPVLDKQLKPEQFVAVAEEKGYPLEFRMQPGYDHGYYFIASFIDDHLRFHAKHFSS